MLRRKIASSGRIGFSRTVSSGLPAASAASPAGPPALRRKAEHVLAQPGVNGPVRRRGQRGDRQAVSRRAARARNCSTRLIDGRKSSHCTNVCASSSAMRVTRPSATACRGPPRGNGAGTAAPGIRRPSGCRGRPGPAAGRRLRSCRPANSTRAAAHQRADGAADAAVQLERLIVHQRDKRRDDKGDAGQHERGQLEAERLLPNPVGSSPRTLRPCATAPMMRLLRRLEVRRRVGQAQQAADLSRPAPAPRLSSVPAARCCVDLLAGHSRADGCGGSAAAACAPPAPRASLSSRSPPGAEQAMAGEERPDARPALGHRNDVAAGPLAGHRIRSQQAREPR